MKRLDVGVNLTWLAPGRVGGSEQYLERQLTGLGDDADITIYCPPAFRDLYPALAARARVVVTPVERDVRLARIALEHSWLARHTRNHDVVHHGGGTIPLVGPKRTVLTIHDLQYREFPHYFSSMRRRYLETMMPRSARRATVIATPSEFVRATVIDAFGVDPARVVVVPHGIPRVDAPGSERIAEVRRRHAVGDRAYVVYPAITHPHKGHQALLDMIAERSDDLTLVLVGGEGEAEAAIRARLEQAPLRSKVVRTGRVSPADRDALVAGAEALVFPSEYEGFGAPLVEAMELGVPVVCSDAAAVREVVADAAIVVADGDWSAGVDAARARCRELVAAGRVRREAFTLEASGAALAEAYRHAAVAPRTMSGLR